jgi:hypothetical protein
MQLEPTDWHNHFQIHFKLALNTQFFYCLLENCLLFYVIQTRPVQLDDFGDEFMRPGSNVSHHAKYVNLTKKERKLTKQTTAGL